VGETERQLRGGSRQTDSLVLPTVGSGVQPRLTLPQSKSGGWCGTPAGGDGVLAMA
jgi:hypothetical protein